ncbi:MAG: DNA/RNA nuclease SfsA, partial [Saccharolobus sp.]
DFSLEFWNAVKEGLKIQVKTFRLIENKIVYQCDIPLCKINLI